MRHYQLVIRLHEHRQRVKQRLELTLSEKVSKHRLLIDLILVSQLPQPFPHPKPETLPFCVLNYRLDQRPRLLTLQIGQQRPQNGLMIVHDGLQPVNVLLDGNERARDPKTDRTEKLMSVCKLLILEMLCVLLVVIGLLDGLLEEIVERVEQFSLLGGFQISEPLGYLVLTKGL